MPNIRQKAKSIANGLGPNKTRLISACAMIALSLLLFCLAFFAPFRYSSNRDVLHVVSIDDKKHEVSDTYVYQTTGVDQSLFKVLEAVTALGDASTLRAFYSGEMVDRDRLDVANNRLKELRARYNEIYSATVAEAAEKGIKSNEKIAALLADKLSSMNLMALDILEVAVSAENTNVYRAVYLSTLVGLFCCLCALGVAAAALVAIAFGLHALIEKKSYARPFLFMKIFTALSALDMMMCVFSGFVPPAGGPLALACVAVIAFFISGLIVSVISDGTTAAVVRNAAVAGAFSVALLCFAIVPSFSLYINGMGGMFTRYPGTVGTVNYSWVNAVVATGLTIPSSAIKIADVLGVIVIVATAVCAHKALSRQAAVSESRSVLFGIAMFLTVALSMALIISVAAVTNGMQRDGILVKYILGACWYISMCVTAACLAASLIIKGKTPDKESAESAESIESAESEAESDNEVL